MVEGLGIIIKRPFGWMLTFSVDGEPYTIGSMFFDSTNTRRKELYGKYYLVLFKVKKLFFENEFTTKKELVDITIDKEPVKDTLFDFYKTFSTGALEKHDNGWLTASAKKQFDLEENTIINNRLLVPVFQEKDRKDLFTMLFDIV